MYTYFISDLHLTPERPEISQHFCQFMNKHAPIADAIYILGDLFEYWIGDDAANLLGAEPILQMMQQASQQCSCLFIAGNRDFLVGKQFTEQTGFNILPDETVINLYGTPTLILHGDSLCTDDIAHQQFRQTMTTNKQWQSQFLSLPIDVRIEQAKEARSQSHQHKQDISMDIMDVNDQAVIDCFKKHNVSNMIHGHTHRQQVHNYKIDNKLFTRTVLGDWYQTDSVLKINKNNNLIENQTIGR